MYSSALRVCGRQWGNCGYIRLLFAYTVPVGILLETRICEYTIRCKGCGENIPARVHDDSGHLIVAECALCEAPLGHHNFPHSAEKQKLVESLTHFLR